MQFLSKFFTLFIAVITTLIYLSFIDNAFAVTIAKQTDDYSDQLNAWQIMQELGNNLNEIAGTFTFRVKMTRPNSQMFSYTGQNSKIYDKDADNSYIVSCYDKYSSSPQRGLVFDTKNAPVGFEDVTLDFSCNNYSFIPGHRYLMLITNANMGTSNNISFMVATSGDYFTEGGLRYGNGQTDPYFNTGNCKPALYKWNDQKKLPNSGCSIFKNPTDDLYFVLTNTAPAPKMAVIFIPGIGGSEFKASQDITWADQDNGHGGTYSHAYSKDENIWVNQTEAANLGEDDYFDVLKMKADGQTPETPALVLTGHLTPFGYGDIDPFFTEMGYEKDKNFFIFPYDWRKDIRSTKADLDTLVETAIQKSGLSQVNIVAHSMGGLVARYYISDTTKSTKVNKLIELGVPHLGSVSSTKTLMYGTALTKDVFGFIPIGVINSEVKDVFQNLASAFQLLPSKYFYNFYDNSDSDKPFPFVDERDIDGNKVIGSLSFDQTGQLLNNLKYNMTTFVIGKQYHEYMDPILNQNNGVKLHNIIGTAQPTLGQIYETWWVTWPINLIPKTEEIFINGDDTVPLYSASLKNNSLDLSGGAQLYYVEQRHSDLVNKNGTAMQTVKSILKDETIPVEVRGQKLDLEGSQLSLDDGELDLYDDLGNHTGINDKGEIETNIPETAYSTSSKTKHAFIKKKAKKVKVKVTRKSKTAASPKTTNIKIRTYKKDKIDKIALFKDIKVSENTKVEFDLDPVVDATPILAVFDDLTKPISTTLTSSSEATGSAALDLAPPITNVNIGGGTITLSALDTSSGVFQTEYSLDNGVNVQTYSNPITITTPGTYTLQVFSTDNLGNQEQPQTTTFTIDPPISNSSASTSSDSTSTNSTSDSNNTTVVNTQSSDPTIQTPKPISIVDTNSPTVLGIKTEKVNEIPEKTFQEKFVKKETVDKQTVYFGGLLTLAIALPGILTATSLLIIAIRPIK